MRLTCLRIVRKAAMVLKSIIINLSLRSQVRASSRRNVLWNPSRVTIRIGSTDKRACTWLIAECKFCNRYKPAKKTQFSFYWLTGYLLPKMYVNTHQIYRPSKRMGGHNNDKHGLFANWPAQFEPSSMLSLTHVIEQSIESRAACLES